MVVRKTGVTQRELKNALKATENRIAEKISKLFSERNAREKYLSDRVSYLEQERRNELLGRFPVSEQDIHACLEEAQRPHDFHLSG